MIFFLFRETLPLGQYELFFQVFIIGSLLKKPKKSIQFILWSILNNNPKGRRIGNMSSLPLSLLLYVLQRL